jgi:PAS domain S-box-containing protein
MIDDKRQYLNLSEYRDRADKVLRKEEEPMANDLEVMTRLCEFGNRCGEAGVTFEQRLNAIVDTAIAITGADRGNVQLLDRNSDVLKIAAHRGFEEPFLTFFASVGSGDPAACGAAMRSAERIVVEDVMHSEVFAGQPSLQVLLDADVLAVQSTPLLSSAGRVLGMISTHFSASHRFSDRVLRLMDLLARQAADCIERMWHERDLAEQARLLDLTWDAITICDPEHRIRYWNKGAQEVYGYTAEQAVGTIMHKLLHCEFSNDLKSIEYLLHKDGRWSGEISAIRADGRRITTASRWVLDRYPDGKTNAILETNNDITARKDAEDTRQLLIDELNHRAKNMLATVQAIAAQSLRSAPTPSDFTAAFSGRIQALARAHSLLTHTGWQETDLATLIDDQLLVDTDADPRISSTGPTVLIEPQLALQLALMIHELGTNARKYGALSLPDGKLSLNWSIHSDGESQLRLKWAEDNGSKRNLPPIGQTGFGNTLIQTIADRGSAHMTSGARGIDWDIHIPLPEEQARDRRLPPTPRQRRAERTAANSKDVALVGKRVLVVEDEPIIALELAAVLETAKVSVVGPTHSLNAARELIKQHTPDAALLDVNIAGQRIDELAVALSRNRVPFAFLTGYGRETLPPQFQDAMLIPKPFLPERLLAGLATLLSTSPHSVLQPRPHAH